MVDFLNKYHKDLNKKYINKVNLHDKNYNKIILIKIIWYFRLFRIREN
jgi:hypothetical protein